MCFTWVDQNITLTLNEIIETIWNDTNQAIYLYHAIENTANWRYVFLSIPSNLLIVHGFDCVGLCLFLWHSVVKTKFASCFSANRTILIPILKVVYLWKRSSVRKRKTEKRPRQGRRINTERENEMVWRNPERPNAQPRRKITLSKAM